MKTIIKKFKAMSLRLFDAKTNVTTDTGLSNEMKTFYSNYPPFPAASLPCKQPCPASRSRSLLWMRALPRWNRKTLRHKE